ncbi:MAG: VWA domain-containing protein [Pseudobdellovibrio sp.]
MSNVFLKWGNSQAFYFLILIAVFVGVYFVFEKYFSLKLNKAFGKKVADYLTQNLSLPRRRLQMALQAVGLVFIIVAFARPQAGESQQQIKSEGIELLVLADVSESMMAEDVKPSRLSQMRIELTKLLELMPGNKIGIIAFAGSSALLSPLTSDPNALRMYIDSLDVNSVSSQGTNFETALSYAKEAFEKGGVTQDNSARTTRVILVVSDGEDQEKGALETAQKLAKEGLRIFTMAYGTEKGGAIPVRDLYGNAIGYKKDGSGQTILTQVKGDFLKSLADAGGGQFYFAYFNGDHLRKFVDDVGTLEKTEFQSSMMTQYEEKFTIPLLIGIIFILISLFISDRKSKNAILKGKYETE